MTDNNELNKKEIGSTSDARVHLKIHRDSLKELEKKRN